MDMQYRYMAGDSLQRCSGLSAELAPAVRGVDNLPGITLRPGCMGRAQIFSFDLFAPLFNKLYMADKYMMAAITDDKLDKSTILHRNRVAWHVFIF